MNRPPMIRLFPDELVVDNFAGGGGASTGIRMAIGRDPDVAINHDPEALALYAANHSGTKIFCEDVHDVPPLVAVGCATAVSRWQRMKLKIRVRGARRIKLKATRCRCGKKHRVGLAWFSPDCTYFSKASGGQPHRDRNKARRRRGLAGVVLKWAEQVRPRVIFVENVEEFQEWGPLHEVAPGKWLPDPSRKGQSFRRWRSRLENLGYRVELKQLRACDFGAPTSRKRLFIIARCDGEAITWPQPTHGPGRAQPYRTAAECIDWSIPCPSIFTRKKPLAEATLRRIARGVVKYVLEAKQPFIVPLTHHDSSDRARGVDEVLPTITGANRGELAVVAPLVSPVKSWGGGGNDAAPANSPLRTTTTSKRGEYAVVAPTLIGIDQRGAGDSAAWPASGPLTTVTTENRHALVAPTLVRTAHGEQDAKGKKRGRGEHGIEEPVPTVTASKDFALVAASLINTRNGEREGQAPRVRDIREPMPTVTAKGSQGAVVAAFLAKHYGGPNGQQTPGSQMDLPMGTVTAVDHHGLVTSHLLKLRGGLGDHHTTAQDLREPAPTLTAGGTHLAEVRAFLTTYYGTDQDPQMAMPLATVTTRDRFALVTVTIGGVEYAIVDIGMRMLTPRELFNAQGFPHDYVIDPVVEQKRGKKTVLAPLSKTEQVHKCGNSVCPPLSEALVRANLDQRATRRKAVG